MSTSFPAALDSFTLNVDNVDYVTAADVNNLQDAVLALETLARQADNNLLYDTLSTEASWLGGTTFSDAANDSYLGGLWNVLWTTNAPDWTRQAGGATDPFQYYLRCTHDSNSQAGISKFLGAKDAIPLRGKTLSLSADLWGTGVTSLRMAVLEWTGTADSVTSDVVSSWSTGNPTLAASWAYIGTPAALTVSSTLARKAVNNLAVSTSANNLAVFIWTDAVEANTDLWNVARVKLEIGAAATDFVGMNYAEEANRIGRYYRVAGGGFLGAFTSATTCQVGGQLSPPMRTTPACTLNSSTPLFIDITAGANRTGSGSALGFNGGASNFYRAVVDGFSGATAGNVVIAGGNYFNLDARL